METFKQIYIEQSIRSQEKYLIDFNVNVEYVVGSSSYDNLEEYICIIELFLKNNNTIRTLSVPNILADKEKETLGKKYLAEYRKYKKEEK